MLQPVHTQFRGDGVGHGDGALRKEMGISYMKRLAASKAPWPSWEFKQEQARMKRSFWPTVDCLLGDSQPYGHQMLSATVLLVFLSSGHMSYV